MKDFDPLFSHEEMCTKSCLQCVERDLTSIPLSSIFQVASSAMFTFSRTILACDSSWGALVATEQHLGWPKKSQLYFWGRLCSDFHLMTHDFIRKHQQTTLVLSPYGESTDSYSICKQKASCFAEVSNVLAAQSSGLRSQRDQLCISVLDDKKLFKRRGKRREKAGRMTSSRAQWRTPSESFWYFWSAKETLNTSKKTHCHISFFNLSIQKWSWVALYFHGKFGRACDRHSNFHESCSNMVWLDGSNNSASCLLRPSWCI